ncbi:ATP-binding protein [Aliikangiella sp. G2MR2-5]|uniref:ATP-binding protein n=1 Tax=Aliikangiella sp. G2MR2-5 TaxID=2788943 RepID=UPI0018AA410E|nr:ATP-binding protein [Aliikangiella sp. G2MR2-5]
MIKLNPAHWPLKGKFISILLLVFLIPVAAILVLKEVEKALLDNLLKNLRLHSELIANRLQSHQDWFEESLLPDSEKFMAKELFVFPLSDSFLLDGYFDDWKLLERFREYFGNKDNRFGILLGESEGALYLSLRVEDNGIIYPDVAENSKADQLEINFLDEQGLYHQIFVSPKAPGKIPVKRKIGKQFRIDWRYNAVWAEYSTGFNLEIKFPSGKKPSQLNVLHYDVDSPQDSYTIVATNRYELSPVVWPSASLTAFTESLDIRPGQRVWLLDLKGRALAQKDRFKEVNWKQDDNPLINWLLMNQDSELKDRRASALRLDSSVIYQALQGQAATSVENTMNKENSIALAATPIVHNDKKLGLVFIEENIASVQLIQQKTLLQMIYYSAITMFTIFTILLWYISRLTLRISRLKNQINEVVDDEGRMNTPIVIESKKGDELDELGNAFAHMSNRLYEYNDYLEQLASRLSHELRTPIAIVRSSLDNLSLMENEEQKEVLQRAISGTERLGEIITRMRRATGIRQAMQNADLETIDLIEMLGFLVEGYRSSFPDFNFQFLAKIGSWKKEVSGELFAEMLDKLVSNAMDFSEKEQPIVVRVEENNTGYVLSVENKGPQIPRKNLKKIFNSLVSIRDSVSSSTTQRGANLGLGLFVVKLIAEFHGGKALAKNLADGSGVAIQIKWDK